MVEKDTKDNTPIIWAMYDDGNGSWNKLNKDNIYSFGIRDNPTWKNYFKIDLSVTNFDLLKQLEKIANQIGYPDIIIFHPPCESWSIADNQRRLIREISGCNNKGITSISFYQWEVIHSLNVEAIQKNQKHLLRTYTKQCGKMLIGLSTACAVVDIINHFRPAIYIVENPQTSKIWDFYQYSTIKIPFKNKTYYNKWNENFTPKPTYFASNFDLKYPIEKTKYTPNKKTLSFGRNGTVNMDYDTKSSVPKELLEFIYSKVMNKIESIYEC